MNSPARSLPVILAFLVLLLPAAAEVKMPAIFGNHMVLQQEAKLPLWGTATTGEKITVTVGAETGNATAGADGKWSVSLAPLPAGTAPVTVTVQGTNTLTFTDVLVGDVWVCSGQSNMEFTLGRAANAATALPQANDPQLRLFLVKRALALDPAADVIGTWMVCTPESAKPFPAVGYFFGHDLRTTLNRPIGLIGTSWGGTPAQAWTSLSGLGKDPELQHYVDISKKIRDGYVQARADYPAKQAAYVTELAQWNRGPGVAYKAALDAWNTAVAKVPPPGQTLPQRPPPPASMPKPPVTPEGGQNAPCVLFNGMIAPLIPYAIKGVTWYQGEANANGAAEYRILFPRMITDWREKWGEGDFPFLFVQLASFKPGGNSWPFLRESQLKTLSLPNTGMAVAIDVGDPNNIHPADKLDVGLRLALAAKHVAYGQTLVYSGPIYDKMEIKNNTIRLTFTQTGSGLVIGTAPWTPTGIAPLPNTALLGFTVAGADKKWQPAQATIEGDAVVVSSDQVPQPVEARYAWDPSPACNLYNKEGLPASPFRTDTDPSDPPPPPK